MTNDGTVSEKKSLLQTIASIPFVFALLVLIGLFFWRNGPAFFGEWGSSESNTMMIYFIMIAIVIRWSGKETISHLRTPISKAIPGFFTGIIIAFVFMNTLMFAGMLSTPSFPPERFWSTIIIQFCVIALAEELIFRGVMLEYLGKYKIIISSIFFALWHSYAYSFIWYSGDWSTFNWGALIFAFMMGLILATIVENSKDITKETRLQIGFPGAIAIHATYNCCIVGALAIGAW